MDISYILLSVVVVFGYILIRRRKKQMSIFKELGISGPEPSLIWGNLEELNTKGLMNCFVEWHAKFGDLVGVYFGSKPFLSIADPEILRNIQMKDAMDFPDKDLFLETFGLNDDRVQYSLELQKGQVWKSLRSILSPTFSTGKVKQMVPIVQEKVEYMLKKIEAQRSKDCVDLMSILEAATMDISASVFTGIEANLQDNPSQILGQGIQGALASAFSDFQIKLFLAFPSLEKLSTRIPNFIWTALGVTGIYLYDKSTEVYRARLAYKDYPRKDALQILLDYNKEITKNGSKSTGEEKHPLTDDQIIANVSAFLFAGYDTTASLVSFTSYLLVQHPEIQEKVRKEIQEVMGTKGTLEYEDLGKLHYLDQVLSEVLRLYPIAPTAIQRRTPNESYTIRGIKIPRVVSIFAPLPALHRSPKYWVNPDKFDPDRFAPEQRASILPTVYQPFGAGPRTCIGMKLAQVNSRMIMARLLAKYRLEKCRDGDKEFPEVRYTMFIIYPKNGVYCNIRPVS